MVTCQSPPVFQVCDAVLDADASWGVRLALLRMSLILADAGYRGLGAQTGGRVVPQPHRKFKKNTSAWYEDAPVLPAVPLD